jgi:hypothetical protein
MHPWEEHSFLRRRSWRAEIFEALPVPRPTSVFPLDLTCLAPGPSSAAGQTGQRRANARHKSGPTGIGTCLDRKKHPKSPVHDIACSFSCSPGGGRAPTIIVWGLPLKTVEWSCGALRSEGCTHKFLCSCPVPVSGTYNRAARHECAAATPFGYPTPPRAAKRCRFRPNDGRKIMRQAPTAASCPLPQNPRFRAPCVRRKPASISVWTCFTALKTDKKHLNWKFYTNIVF